MGSTRSSIDVSSFYVIAQQTFDPKKLIKTHRSAHGNMTKTNGNKKWYGAI